MTLRLIAEFIAASERTKHSPAALSALTDRGADVMTLVAGGLTNDEIAERLVISPATAKTHVGRVLFKLGARDRAQLVVMAYERPGARRPRGVAGALLSQNRREPYRPSGRNGQNGWAFSVFNSTQRR